MAKKAKEPKVKVGDRIGKLTVVKQVDMPVKTKRKDKDGCEYKELNGRTQRGWFCKCDCGGTIEILETTLLSKRSCLRSCNKCSQVKDINYAPKKMTYEDVQSWEKLYEYVKTNVLKYDEKQLLPQYMLVRLLGLSRGKYIANNKSINNADYSYEVILNTFKFCSLDIQKALQTKQFKNEEHKFNYILKIVEQNINTVYMKMKQHQKAKEEAELADISHTTEYINTFKKRDKKTNNKLNELW